MDSNKDVVVSSQGVSTSQKVEFLAIFMNKVNALIIILVKDRYQ